MVVIAAPLTPVAVSVVVAGSFVVVDVSDDDSDVGLSAVVFDADSDAEVTTSSLRLNKIVLLEPLGCSCRFV